MLLVEEKTISISIVATTPETTNAAQSLQMAKRNRDSGSTMSTARR